MPETGGSWDLLRPKAPAAFIIKDRTGEVTVEFGIELMGKTGAVLVAASASAQLKVSLTWRPGEAG